jgi:hypothetical protein
MLVTKASITLTREQVAEIAAVFNEEFLHDARLQTMTVLFDPDAVAVGE